jgi:pSer/pThr/pTyr-binding forkhead associated (FHA) protein
MFNCRECPIREGCIQESSTSPSVKLMMIRAFETGRDTREMWGLLQNDCLILKEQEEAQVPRPRTLRRRLKGEGEGEAAESVEKPEATLSPATASEPPRRPQPAPPLEPTIKPIPSRLRKVKEQKPGIPSPRFCLKLQGGQHRIALPQDGEIVLGRFDPTTSVTPDVDLSYDDREHFVISRRHARVIGRNGIHEIEDLGSTNGTRVRGKKLEINQRVQLKLGDEIALGYSSFLYISIPEMPALPPIAPPQAHLWGAFTGHRFPLPSWGEVIVGRSDPVVSFTAEIDLSEEGDAAQVVARRHVKIIANDGRHYVEDLGSANGAKLNGVRMRISELRLLSPGDHLWLGGCVLAYDVQPEFDQ